MAKKKNKRKNKKVVKKPIEFVYEEVYTPEGYKQISVDGSHKFWKEVFSIALKKKELMVSESEPEKTHTMEVGENIRVGRGTLVVKHKFMIKSVYVVEDQSEITFYEKIKN